MPLIAIFTQPIQQFWIVQTSCQVTLLEKHLFVPVLQVVVVVPILFLRFATAKPRFIDGSRVERIGKEKGQNQDDPSRISLPFSGNFRKKELVIVQNPSFYN
jgi:hypothetical protein